MKEKTVITVSCPACKKLIKCDGSSNKYKCPICGSIFSAEDAKAVNLSNDSVIIGTTDTDVEGVRGIEKKKAEEMSADSSVVRAEDFENLELSSEGSIDKTNNTLSVIPDVLPYPKANGAKDIRSFFKCERVLKESVEFAEQNLSLPGIAVCYNELTSVLAQYRSAEYEYLNKAQKEANRHYKDMSEAESRATFSEGLGCSGSLMIAGIICSIIGGILSSFFLAMFFSAIIMVLLPIIAIVIIVLIIRAAQNSSWKNKYERAKWNYDQVIIKSKEFANKTDDTLGRKGKELFDKVEKIYLQSLDTTQRELVMMRKEAARQHAEMMEQNITLQKQLAKQNAQTQYQLSLIAAETAYNGYALTWIGWNQIFR